MTQAVGDTATLAMNIDRLMRRVHSQLHPKAGEFDKHRVGPVGGMVLLSIAEEAPVDAQTVCALLGRDKSQISRLLKRFESEGLIERHQRQSDGRSSLLTLTDAGNLQVRMIQEALTSTIGDILGSLSIQEQETLSKILVKVLAS